MANDGQIVFEVTADGRHAIADIQDITRAIQRETRRWDDSARQSTGNIENSFASLAKNISIAGIAMQAGKALLDFGKAAVQAASELEEVQNVVDVTFGNDASKINSWAKNAGTQFGLTETQAKKFTSTMGAMLKSSGLAGAEITDMSTTLAGLSADMASFYNMDFEEAFQKIRSGISGETEPLKALGINMSVANLEAFALQQGMSKTFKEMSQSEQIMLRYQYLMSATADAQGDFARTSDGYANSVRMLETNLEQLKTTIGTAIIPVVSDLVSDINSLFSDRSGQKTVLDDFADIDASTEAKLAQISTTAQEAQFLADELDKIGRSNVGNAGTKLQNAVDSLANINLDQGKAGVVKDFISTLSNNIDALSSIQGSTNEEAKKWLDGIAESANKLDSEDAEGWTSLIELIKTGLPGFENTDFGSSFFAALGKGFTEVGEKSSVLQWAVDMLGNKTDRTAQEQKLWLETCKRLVQTIPGLSSIINTETGEVKGGTQAVRDYIKAWEEGQTKLALMKAVEEKEAAYASRFSDLPGLELDMAVAKRRVKKSYDQLKALYESYGLEFIVDENGIVTRNYNGYAKAGIENKDRRKLAEETDYYEKLYKESVKATEAYETQKAALEEAETAIEEYRATVEEMPGTVEEATDATEDWLTVTGKTEEEIKSLVSTAKDAVADLADYVAEVRQATSDQIDGVVKGFGKIETTSDTVKDLTDKMSKLDTGSDAWKELNDELDKVNQKRVSAANMQLGLEDQLEYMTQYMEFMEKAKANGASDELLASLSDGSVESYEYLRALAEGTPEQVETITKKYQEVIDKKAEMTGALSEKKLSVDETYKSLAEEAKKAVEALDLEGEAKTNTGKTLDGIVTEITSHVGDTKEAVDAMLAELNRLSSWGIGIDLGGFGVLNFRGTGVGTNGSHLTGMDYVPFDNYIARLHEGEAVLTAEENRVWQGLHNGGLANVDLDALGGVMHDSIKPGGNVYLDGKMVGVVVSDRQGRSYKSMQRSGWQQ